MTVGAKGGLKASRATGRWLAIPIDEGEPIPRELDHSEGDRVQVRTGSGRILWATWDRGMGGSHAYYHRGEPLDVAAVRAGEPYRAPPHSGKAIAPKPRMKVSMSDEQRARWEAAAALAGLPVATWLAGLADAATDHR